MTEKEKQFIESFLYGDGSKDDAVGRLQVKEWYKAFGEKVLRDVDLAKVTDKINSDDKTKYWKYSSGDPIFDRKAVVNELLEMRGDDGEYLLDNYDRYQLACWSSSYETLKNISLEEYKGKDSHVDFAERLDSDSKLMGFWYRYDVLMKTMPINESDPIDPDRKTIGHDVLGLLKGHGFSLNNLGYYKYGFECAKEEGCVEGFEFFLKKLKEKISEEEINQLLIDTALYAAMPSRHFSLKHSNAHMIKFCLTHLYDDQKTCLEDQENYKKLLEKDHKTYGRYAILDKFRETYWFGHIEDLMDCLGPQRITNEQYGDYFISGVTYQIQYAPNRGLMQRASKFLEKVWEKEAFAEHKKYCLEQLSQGDFRLIYVLSDLAQRGAFIPLLKILNSEGCDKEKIAESFRDSYNTRIALYARGEEGKEILRNILGNTDHFITDIESSLKDDSFKKINAKINELQKESDIEKFRKGISDIVSDGKLVEAIKEKEAIRSSISQRGDQELLSPTSRAADRKVSPSKKTSRLSF